MDMQVDGEDPTWLQKAIASTVDCLQNSGVGTKGMYLCTMKIPILY